MTQPTVPTRAGAYLRISQDRVGAGLGVDRQEQDCRELATKLGWTITAVFSDNDVSAYSGKRRPGYENLLDAIRQGQIDAVLTLHNDRLIKAPRELEDYIDLCSPRGIPTHTVWAGNFDLSTPTGRAVARTVGAWARFEGEHKSERTRRAQKQAAEAGRWLGGTPPFGWTLHSDGSAEIDPGPAGEVISATERLLAGASLASIVRDLNARGILTSRGNTWDSTSLRAVLKRPRNAGIVTLNGTEVGKSLWPAILPEEDWRSAVALLDDPVRRKSPSNLARRVLSGLALCGKEGCRLPMRSSATRSGTNYIAIYRCTSTDRSRGHASRRIEPLEEYVDEMVLERLAHPAFKASVQPAGSGIDLARLNLEADKLRRRKAEAEEMFAEGEIERPALAKITAQVTTALDRITAQMASGVHTNVLGGLLAATSPPDLWRSWDVEQRRRALPAIVTIVVLPGGRGGHKFRPELVVPEWSGRPI